MLTSAIALSDGGGFESRSGTDWDYVRGLSAITLSALKMVVVGCVSMYICVCMYMYMCMYVCMYVCVYVYVCVCMYVCVCGGGLRLKDEDGHKMP